MRFHLTIAAILMVLIAVVPAAGAYRPPVESEPLPGTSSVGALVRVNRRTVLTLRGASGSVPPEARAGLVAERLSAAIEAGLSPAAVLVRQKRRQPILFAGSKELIRPTRADAHAAGTTPRRLALRWAAALRQTLALPPLTVSARSLLIPFGESRALRVGGVAAGPFELDPVDPAVAVAELAGDGRSIRVRAGQPGATVLKIAAEGAELRVPIVVKKYAGEAAPPVTIDCTGRPAPGELLRQLVLETYPRALRLEPGARLAMLGPPRLPDVLAPGQEGWGIVPVRLFGPDLLPRRAEARVRLRCRPLPPREAEALLYSNHPEQIRRPRRLYQGEVTAGIPSRLLYHHQNRSGRTLLLGIDLINPDTAPVELQVIEGAARPKIDAVLAGQRAGARYLRRAFCDAGQIEALPGGGRLPLLRQRVPAGYTASGLYGLRLLSGRRVQVEVRADPVRAHDPGAAGADATAVAGSVYAHPSREMHASFTVGKSWTFVRLGKRVSPASAASGSGGPVLDGDYGILYDIAVRLDNPTPAPHVVRLLLAPDAGGAQGVFLVNGKWIEAPHVSPPAEFELAQFLLGPQEHRVVNIRTLPVGGSAYPVTLVVR